MRALIIWFALGFSVSAWGWVECDPDAIHADRFEDVEVSNLVTNGYFVDFDGLAGEPENWSVFSGTYAKTSSGLEITTEFFDTNDWRAELDSASIIMPAGENVICVSASLISNAHSLSIVIRADFQQITLKPGPGDSGVFTKTMTTEGNLTVDIDFYTLAQETAEIGWIKITTHPRPGNLMTGF